MAEFWLAVGARPLRSDIEMALASGQRHFLVPAGSAAARMLRPLAGVEIALDSGAWPPCNPQRLSLHAYWRELRSWRTRRGWRCAWFAGYDHIGDVAATERDYEQLMTWIAAEAPDAPLVPVAQYRPDGGRATLDQIVADLRTGWASRRFSVQAGNGGPRPAYALGGLVPHRSTTAARTWFHEFCVDYAAATADLPSMERGLHLFGLGTPQWLAVAPPITQSGDSSGPVRMAQYSGAGRAYPAAEQLGYEPSELAESRALRLAYFVARYRAQLGLPWRTATVPNPAPSNVGWQQESFAL